ncbi:MAG: hypothetical protein NUK65_02865 [Firmicutes bacterium]|nr:hypothetical protein [Bacillota bacterium]
MPVEFLHPLKAIIFILLMVVLVPKAEIRRLAGYGLLFGSVYDVIGLTIGHLTKAFSWINFGRFGYGYLPLDSPISWCAFYIMYFYLMPKHKPLIYLFPISGVVMSMIYSRVLVNFGMFDEPDSFLLRVANFSVWFTYATWGYLKLNRYIERKHAN